MTLGEFTHPSCDVQTGFPNQLCGLFDNYFNCNHNASILNPNIKCRETRLGDENFSPISANETCLQLFLFHYVELLTSVQSSY